MKHPVQARIEREINEHDVVLFMKGTPVFLQHKLVTETLGIKHLHALIGMSMGGMNA